MDKKEYMKLYRQKNKEKLSVYNKEYQKKYREANKEKLKQKRKAYDDLHREKLREKSREYAFEHKEEACKRAKEYYKKNREYCLKRNKLYRTKQEVHERMNELSRINYYRDIEMLTTSMYCLPDEVIILDEKHISYDGIVFVIHRRGYLRCAKDTLHVYMMKKAGKWFEGCEVHHADGDTLNNRLENLICLTKEQHNQAHKLMREDRKAYEKWLNEQKQTVKNKLEVNTKEV